MLYKNGALVDLQGNPIARRAVEVTRHFQKTAVRKLTRGELAFCRLASPLWARAKVRYVKQVIYYVAPGISFRCDFVFKDYRLAVEVDGESHRGRKELDDWRSEVLQRLAGLRTIRFTNDDCTERYSWARLRLVDALCAQPRGFKVHIEAYRDELLGDPDFMKRAREQNPGVGGR